ncbi:unnamed protein product [Cylicocyclus nassatus]|uniref:Uncharacterized protein n=1 Tax=Cylicocyclus nassatus TaxID=53992 RepID=A0AA36M7P5_CYLNA|nr:unnamed protein product [Cylicocyclus nassatus]
MFWKAIVVLVAFLAQVSSKFREEFHVPYPYPKGYPMFNYPMGGKKGFRAMR